MSDTATIPEEDPNTAIERMRQVYRGKLGLEGALGDFASFELASMEYGGLEHGELAVKVWQDPRVKERAGKYAGKDRKELSEKERLVLGEYVSNVCEIVYLLREEPHEDMTAFVGAVLERLGFWEKE